MSGFPHRQEYGNTSVLVTGGAGFIGSNLCRTLLERGFVVYAVDNFITGREENITPLLENARFHFTKIDVTDTVFYERFADIPVDYVYHLACPTGVPNIKILGEQMLLTSAIGTKNTLQIAQLHNARLLFTSSSEIYGEPEAFPQHEDYTGNVNPIGPRSAYEEGKRFSESMIALYVRKYGINARIVRLFNTYGPGMSLLDQRVIPQFLNSILQGSDLLVYGDGNQTRTHLYVDDLIRALFLVMEGGNDGEVYNIGGEIPITVRQLAESILKIISRRWNGTWRKRM